MLPRAPEKVILTVLFIQSLFYLVHRLMTRLPKWSRLLHCGSFHQTPNGLGINNAFCTMLANCVLFIDNACSL